MSTLRITNIEAKADPSSPTVDEKIKLTNSNGDILVHIDGKTSGITTIGINTTAGNIKFDQNSNVVVTGIITATSFSGDGSALTGIDATQIQTGNTSVQTVDTGSNGHVKINTEGSERLRIDSTGDVRFAGTNLTNNTNKNVNLTAPSYNTSEEDVNLVQVENESGMNQISFGGGTSALNAATTLRFLTASAVNTTTGTERLRITSDGKVGINETSPTAPLSIKVGSGGEYVQDFRGSATKQWGFYFLQNNWNAATFRIDEFASNGTATSRLSITNGGKIGFNAANPPRDYCFHSGQADTNIQITNNTTGIDDSAGSLIQQDGNDLYIWNKENSFMSLGTNAAERVRITSGGDVSIGGMNTNSFSNYRTLTIGGAGAVDGSGIDLERSDGTIYGRLFADTNGLQIGAPASGDYIRFETQNTERVRISSSGSVGIGINNPQDYHANANSLVTSSGITLANTSQGSIYFADSSSGAGEYVGQINYIHSNNRMEFIVNNTERMRLSGNGEHMVYSNGTVSALRTAASSSGSAEILYCTRNSSSVTVGTGVYAIYSNGSASSLSDRTQKKNIETTRDGYLEDLNRLRVVKYNWNDQEDGTPKELGLIAQEVEEVFPGLISNMRSDVGIGTTASTKGVKTSVLPYMLLKALQEANAEIVALKARVNTLEG